MAVITYKKLALSWRPVDKTAYAFNIATTIVLCLTFILAIVVSSIPVPEQERRVKEAVPDRVAKFIAQKEKPPVPVQPPKPKPEPKPIKKIEQKPKIERKKPSEIVRKPLTEVEKKARETAEKSGLLALASELNDLMDTSNVSSQVTGELSNKAEGANTIAGHDTNIINSGVAQSGGGVDSDHFASTVGRTQLSAREIARLNNELLNEHQKALNVTSKTAKISRSGYGRSEEDVTIVFDKNKGSLYSLYERERRNTPGLQGKIVLQITISSSGQVTQVKILSSELNSPALEARLISRIKQFKFESGNVDSVTVTYPIEFLPS